MSQDTLQKPMVIALTPALANLARKRSPETDPAALSAVFRSIDTLRENGDEHGRKQLLRGLIELFVWLPVGTSVAINSKDGSWIVAPDPSQVIKEFVEMFGQDAPGRMFTVGRPTHVGGGLCSK
jgi:hypothetical protein